MARYWALRLEKGQTFWSQIENSKTAAKYCDAILVILEQDGYYIDEEGNCVKMA